MHRAFFVQHVFGLELIFLNLNFFQNIFQITQQNVHYSNYGVRFLNELRSSKSHTEDCTCTPPPTLLFSAQTVFVSSIFFVS